MTLPFVPALLAPALWALLITLAVMPLAIRALHALKVLDVPNARSSHTVPTVRGGGLGVAVGVSLTWCLLPHEDARAWILLGAAALGGALGFGDDLKGLPARARLGLQIAIAGAALGLLHVTGFAPVSPGWVAVALVYSVGYVNAFNFMDGINGISGSQAACVGVSLALLPGIGADVSAGGMALAGSALGFLPFNAPRARVFLGDVGAYFIGAWIAVLTTLAFFGGQRLEACAAPSLLYALDTGTTLVRRWRRGDRLFQAHREHAYQRLTNVGLGHVSASAVVTVATAACAGLGHVAARAEGVGLRVAVTCGMALVAWLYLSLPGWLGQRA